MPVADSASRLRPRLAALMLVIACALLVPSTALATEYTVNSTADEPDLLVGVNGCLSAGGKCTLRAAIEEANAVATGDVVKFDATIFKGLSGNTITLLSSLPAIKAPLKVDGDAAGPGGQCNTTAGVPGPCVEVSGPGSGGSLAVENANGVEIEGLAIAGAAGTAINVINSSEGFQARDNWIGVKLDGSTGANNKGIFLDPTSGSATIGNESVAGRNVFANNSFEGLDIQGTSNVKVQGNYFGVKPDGSTPAPNIKDIEVTDSSAFKAVGNEIGANVGVVAAATSACDGGCNVFASAPPSLGAIDLKGDGGEESPASGPNTIHGNYIGLTASGAALAASAEAGIRVGGADSLQIGGSGVGEANHINGGTYGVFAGIGANDLVVDGNLIGLNPAGTEMLFPPGEGIFNSSEGLINATHAAEITDNRIAMPSGIAIEQHSVGALISGNHIGRGVNGEILSAGTTGIKLWGSFGASVVESNVIENPSGNGILIENENNEMVGNVIEGAGLAGIRIQDFLTLSSTGNAIGGDTEGKENAISESGGDAIEVAGEEDDDTQIKRNFGDNNGGLFIDLGADGSGNKVSGPNDGIQAPTISTATVSGASGAGARAGATIRVFRKATASAGEIASFLGEATANGSGNWSLVYGSSIPGGTPIAVTQSDIEGTSELTLATTATPPSGGGSSGAGTGGNGSGGGGNGKGKGANKDKTAPETTIVKGPKAKSHKTTAKFKFVSSEASSTFECKLDRKPFKKCKSPKTYKRLKPGKHVFKVRAKDAAGNVDKSPAKRKFRVLG